METQWITQKSDPETARKISRILGCHRIIATLLVNRGITTPEAAYTFLHPSMTHLTDPFTLKDMQKAVERIYTALINREKILIFGDFDADGITSTALLYDFFHHVAAEISWYIPHRIKEGFSLKPPHIEMAVDRKCDLLITVDCGSDSHDAVKRAIREDIDVIITDHHEVTTHIPPAFAVINPKRPDCGSGLNHLAGVGVALYLVIALRTYLRSKGFWREIEEPNLVDYCDLFAVGTIADMVPVKGENRILSQAGIGVLRSAKRTGFKALTKVSKIDPAVMDSDDISFRIAPRLNAAGRISHARICVDLLTEKKRIKADQTAAILNELNKKRQEMERSIVDEAEKKILSDPSLLKESAIVLHASTWSPGVIGIAASKLCREYSRPVILISTMNAPATGSCRSINQINIHDALCRCREFLENFGGHPMAAGLTIQKECISPFTRRFCDEIKAANSEDAFIKRILIDATLDINEITSAFTEELERLRPFGSSNPEPLFHCSNLEVVSSFMMGSRHRKMVVRQANKKLNENENRVEALQFNINPEDPPPMRFEHITCRLRMNRFQNKNRPQIIIEAVKE